MTSQSSSSRLRIALVALALLLGLALLVIQLVRWQVVQRDEFGPATGLFGQTLGGRSASATAADGAAKSPDRGAIIDINGVPLAFDTYQWEIWIEPRLFDVLAAIQIGIGDANGAPLPLVLTSGCRS